MDNDNLKDAIEELLASENLEDVELKDFLFNIDYTNDNELLTQLLIDYFLESDMDG